MTIVAIIATIFLGSVSAFVALAALGYWAMEDATITRRETVTYASVVGVATVVAIVLFVIVGVTL